jgi:hypothetical protein
MGLDLGDGDEFVFDTGAYRGILTDARSWMGNATEALSGTAGASRAFMEGGKDSIEIIQGVGETVWGSAAAHGAGNPVMEALPGVLGMFRVLLGVYNITSAVMSSAFWAWAAAGIASHGPFFAVALSAVLIGLAILAGVAMLTGSESPRSMPASPPHRPPPAERGGTRSYVFDQTNPNDTDRLLANAMTGVA